MEVRYLFIAASLVATSLATHGATAKPVGITALRAKLLAQGWSPVETFGSSPAGQRWSLFADAGEMYRAGLTEVAACSGTGLNYCTFYYQKGKQCLQVSTQGEFKKGEYEPLVMGTKKVCPPADDLRPPKR